MDSVEKLNKLFNIDGAPTPPTLMSLRHDDIIKCLIESAVEIEFWKGEELKRTDGSVLDLSMQTQEKWLRDVTNCDYENDYGTSNPVNWKNNSSVNFAKLNLASAGQRLNVIKWEEEGIDDWIGQNFPAFKNNLNYQPYPKNYDMFSKRHSTLSVEDIAEQIKSKSYSNNQKIDLLQFFNHLGGDVYVPKPNTRIQPREKDRDIERIDSAVNKIEASGDSSNLEDLTCIYFPTEVLNIDGTIFAEENSMKIDNGSHTAEMRIRLGMTESNANIVNFDTQLGRKISKCFRLGNLLNKQEVEKRDVAPSDVKKELFIMMDERHADGLKPNLPKEEKEELANTYTCVTLGTIGQWESHYEKGGSRTAPRKEWSDVELAQQRLLFQNQLDYADYAVLEARTIASFHDTGVAQIFTKTMDENKRKALVIFYCSTKSQVEDLKNGKKELIEKRYAQFSEFHNIKISTTFLRYE